MAPLTPRQTPPAIIIPATYSGLDSGLSAGQIVGIVLGSVAGFVLLAWLLYTTFGRAKVVVAAEPEGVVHERRKTRRGSAGRGRGRREYSEGGTRRIVVVEERRETRGVSGGGSRSVGRSRSRGSGSSGDVDEVVVIEDHSPSPPPQRHHHRSRSRRESESGYREVDPRAYGGGDVPMREVRGGSRR